MRRAPSPVNGGGGRPAPAAGDSATADASVHGDLVEAPAQLLRGIDGVLVRAGDAVHPVEGAGHAAELAHGAEELAVEIELHHAADAADIHHLAWSGRHA